MSGTVASGSQLGTAHQSEVSEATLPGNTATVESAEDDGQADLHDLEETDGFLHDEEDGNSSQNDTKRPSYSHRFRSQSLSSISFAFDILPIPISRDALDPMAQEREVKHLNMTAGIALVVGMQVGSGIFSSPGVLAADCGSVGMSLLVWVGAALLSWTGASSFAELGAAIPLSGGAQAYLRYAYGPTISYLFSWTAITVLKPGSAAIISIIFGEYLCRIMYHTAWDADSEESAKGIPTFMVKLVAMGAIVIISFVNSISLKVGTGTQIFLTVIKLLALLSVAVMGFVQLGLGRQSDSFSGNIFEGSTTSLGRYALAFYSGLWAFDGWDQCCFVAGEMKNAARDLPRVIHISMTTVMILYVTANVSYFIVLPKSTVTHSNTLGLDFGKAMFGPLGGVLFAVIVAISCFGALNGHFITSSRLIQVSAKEGYIPKLFARNHPTRKTPINATLLLVGITFIMIIVGSFKSLVTFFGFAGWLFYLLAVLGLLILRSREPNLPRPYKTYLITPVIFCCVALFLLFMPIFSAPLEALLAFGFIIAGYPVYLFTQVQPRRRTIVGIGQADLLPPPTKSELILEYLREIPQNLTDIFRRKQKENGGTYEAVELEEEAPRKSSANGETS